MSQQAKAVIARGINQPVVVEEISVESPRRHEVMIKLAACGVCHSDLSVTNGTIPFPLPIVLGHEGAGVVVEVGEGVTEYVVGDPVISSFVNMCGKCRYCATGRPQLCDQAGKSAVTLPDGTVRTHDKAGQPLSVFTGCGVMTGWGAACNTAKVDAGSICIVFGCGGVGLNAIQGCSISGAAMIVAVDTADHKLEMAKVFGATHTVNVSGNEAVAKTLKKLTGGGADYAFECVGFGAIVTQAYDSLRKGGKAVVVGVAKQGDTSTVRTSTLTFEEKTLTGSYFGSARPREDFPRLMSLYKAGKLKLDELITRRYRVDEAPQAFDDLAAGRNARGMIVF